MFGLVLPVSIRYEGSGAVLRDANGAEHRFADKALALAVHAALEELYCFRKERAAREYREASEWPK